MKQSRDRIIFNVGGFTYLLVFAAICLLPFLLIISASLTENSIVQTQGFQLIPPKLSFEAYAVILQNPATIVRSYLVTIFVTVVGTGVSILFTSMAAYVLFTRSFKARHALAFFFYFTMLFHGGLVPFYMIMVRTYQLKDTLFALILPQMIGAWYILLTRNFFYSIPESIFESARIDGAGHFLLYRRITLPLSVPVLVTIGLFVALNYWNNWYNALLFIENEKLYPLQYYLYRMLTAAQFAAQSVKGPRLTRVNIPAETIKMAMAVIATGPIIFLFPFAQRYFIKGIHLGAVKS